MAFSKEQQTELKHIEQNLSRLESLSSVAGLDLDTWNPEMQFEDFSIRKRELIQKQSGQRQATFKAAGQGQGQKKSIDQDKISA